MADLTMTTQAAGSNAERAVLRATLDLFPTPDVMACGRRQMTAVVAALREYRAAFPELAPSDD